MKLSTGAEIPDYPFQLDHHGGILMLGSCFTDNIGRKLERFLFPVEINPFGTIFNPLSVKRSLEALMKRDAYGEKDLEQHGEIWLSFDHYTGFSAPDMQDCLDGINQRFIPAKKALGNASFLILSWGTAWVYRMARDGRPVSNCHKLPAKYFHRSRLSPEEISDSYNGLLKELFASNPGLRVLLTVSPVRHLKDGAHGNQLSKATLLLAAERLSGDFPDRLFYFPSYEIVMDELRDYRFYDSDLTHLNETAIQYIWEKFCGSLVSEQSRAIIRDLAGLLNLTGHRQVRTGGTQFAELMQKIRETQMQVIQKYPFLEERTRAVLKKTGYA